MMKKCPEWVRELKYVFCFISDPVVQENSLDSVSHPANLLSSTSSMSTALTNSVSTNSIGNPLIPPAPSPLTNSIVMPSPAVASNSATTNSLITTQANVNSSSSNGTPSNSSSSKPETISTSVIMNGPVSPGGPLLHKVRYRALISWFEMFSNSLRSVFNYCNI